MLFSSIEFLFYYLPVTVGVYFLLPGKLRNFWLLLASLFFYGWGEPKNLFVMVFTIVSFYGIGLAMGRGKHRRFWLTLSVVIGLGLLAVFKYSGFAVENVNTLLGLAIPYPKLALPIGISFYTFQLLSYTIDVYRGEVEPQRNLIDFGCYVVLFPQLIAGPIVRYIDVARELKSRRTTLADFYAGIQRFILGLSKKILLANQLGQFVELFRGSDEKSLLFSWLYAAAFSMHIYFDFSGYSDMAIGLGRIFGFHFCENFDYPFISGSIQEFWRRWHMSLGSWFRDYLYIPLGGSRVSRGKWLRNVLFVWLFTGAWHGAAWNFVIWGLYFAGFLLLEKQFGFPARLPKVLRHGYVLLTVMISFVIFNAADMGQAFSDLGGMFGGTGLPLVTPETLYYLRSYSLIFLLAAMGCLPVIKNYVNSLPEKLLSFLGPLVLTALLLICTAYLVDGSFNPFLYFRF